MSKFITSWDTTAQYDAVKDSLVTPQVALTKDNNTVHYQPKVTPPTPSHDYVEIGGIKWATMNIGANSITDTGLYFQWGDTQGYTAAQVGVDKIFSEANYKYYDNGDYTKYTGEFGDGLEVLQPSDDAVAAVWGGNWRIPTTAEFETLSYSVDYEWTDDYQGSGVSGVVCTDKTDSSKVLFFPAAGYCDWNSVCQVGNNGLYWANGVECEYEYAGGLRFYYDTDPASSYTHREFGLPIRGVLDE